MLGPFDSLLADFDKLYYGILLSIFDMQNCLSGRVKILEPSGRPLDDYTIVIPLFRDPSYLKNLEYLKRHSKHVLICMLEEDNERMQRFATELESYGLRVLKVTPQSHFYGDAKYAVIRAVLCDPETYELLRLEGVEVITSRYACFLDADSFPESDIGRVCAAMEEHDIDVASVKIHVKNSRRLIERLQKIEYEIAMSARHFRPWLTSGACCVCKTSALRQIMHKHSLYFAGGDIEVGVLARLMKFKIAHVNFHVDTFVPSSFKSWFNQRRLWCCGGFRTAVINFDKHLSSPLYLIYTGGLVYLALLRKWQTLVHIPWILPVMILFYVPITFISNWRHRDPYMFIFPVYAAFQVLVLTFLGILKYLYLLIKYRVTGRIRTEL